MSIDDSYGHSAATSAPISAATSAPINAATSARNSADSVTLSGLVTSQSTESFEPLLDSFQASKAETDYLPLLEKINGATELEQLFSIQKNINNLLMQKRIKKKQGETYYRTLNRKNVKNLERNIKAKAVEILGKKTELANSDFKDFSKGHLQKLRHRNEVSNEFTDSRMILLIGIIHEAVTNGYAPLIHAALKNRAFHRALRQPQGCCSTTTWRLLERMLRKKTTGQRRGRTLTEMTEKR